MEEITNLRAVSDQKDYIHAFSMSPVAMGTKEIIDGMEHEVVSNTQTTIVSYRPTEDWRLHLRDYRQFLGHDEDEYIDYDGITQKEAKELLENTLSDIVLVNGYNELYETERMYMQMLGMELN